METVKLPCLKLLLTACMLTHATSKSVGLDLYSPTNVLIPAHDEILVDVGVAFQIPMGYCNVNDYPSVMKMLCIRLNRKTVETETVMNTLYI